MSQVRSKVHTSRRTSGRTQARRTSVVSLAALALALVGTLLAAQSGSAAPGRDGAWTSQPAGRYAGAQRETQQTWRAVQTAAQTAGQGAKAGKTFGAQPVLSYRGAADPTVVRYPGGWLAVSTGPAAPRAVAPSPGGPWTNIPSALTALPSWAISGRIWASDLVQVGGTWLLYFSAEVAGLGLDGRCIGVATATDPTATFVPDERPVVCPKGAAAPAAYDKIKRRGKGMPKNGVIDPEYFKDRGGQQYLMYRTQSIPSSIRIVALPASGRAEGNPVRSTEMVRSNDDVIENPTMVRRGRTYVLITSEGYFGDCSYITTSRRSVKITDWSRSKRQVMLNQAKTGLCGPGGADLGRGPNNELMLFLHAWTCPSIGNCPAGVNYDRTSTYDARRSMFAGTLKFTKRKAPRIAAWTTPILPPPCTPVTPTATVTVTGTPTSTPVPPTPAPANPCPPSPTVTTTLTVAPTSAPAARP
ncbi:family 43 glycosylhydrolase [Nocardioides flavescens]|uniref:Family 43 glycosylhydrolase n=1 Tax=Nocardioides flavescens TaxID=2691959 RepID=A0A6L7EQN6_9ACTN|nr:family 43 glycosylhydrolase [Nocardioides flavescens]MXG89623.1 family 43 glycosylhydrolase [Nocardioides flavescens]